MGEGKDGDRMRTCRIMLFVAAVAASTSALAATELHLGAAGFQATLVRDAAPLDAQSAAEPTAGDAASIEDRALAVDEAGLERALAAAPNAAKHDPFKWVFMLIAFAGLTAVFAGRRSGGRGLITG